MDQRSRSILYALPDTIQEHPVFVKAHFAPLCIKALICEPFYVIYSSILFIHLRKPSEYGIYNCYLKGSVMENVR